jgi:hypothetical protein
MKRFSVIIAILLVVVVGVAVWAINADRSDEPTTQQQATESDAERFAQEYPQTPADNRFVYVSSEEIIEIFEDGSGLVFLGFPECPWCQEITPILHEAAVAENLDEIYYYNIREDRESNDPAYQQLVGYLEEYLRTDEDGTPRIYVPDISAVRNGEIVGHFLQETADDGEQVTPQTYWTDERSERAIDQLREMIRNTQDD